MRYIQHSLVILFLFFAHFGYSQPYSEATYEDKLAAADQLVYEGFYLDAIDVYRDCYSESRDPSLLSTLADLQFMIRDFKRAKRSYERIFRQAKKEDYPELVFPYARILKMDGDYNEAYRHFSLVVDYTKSDSLRTLASNEIEGMRIASNFEARYDLYVTALPKEVNTSFSDLAPVEGPEGNLYFTSFDRNSYVDLSEGKDKKDDPKKFAKIFTASRNKDGEWEKKKALPEDINLEDYHMGNVAFSPDGQRMFLTRTELTGREVLSSEIMMSTFDGAEWSAPEALTGVNDEYNSLHPMPGELYGKEVLFFVSNRPGGRGGYDIYYAEYKGGISYSLAVNLGDSINTLGDEFTPFYANGTLYFSSNGHPTMGGMDIFFSNWDGTKWSTPDNMGLGYNSRYDDMYFTLNIETDQGFLVSNRPNDEIRSLRSEACCDDIYSVGIKDIVIEALTSVFHEGEPLLGATIEVAQLNKDGEVVDANSVTGTKGNTFKFRLQADKKYRIYFSKDGFVTDSIDLNTIGMNQSYTFKRQMDLTEAEPEMELITINEPIRMNNIYYDYDDDKILPSAEEDLMDLKELMDKYPSMIIELASHTDARGIDRYNQDLSQRRANSAKQWLVGRGIASERIKAKGYGEDRILNHCRNGVACSEEEHQKNRRTEFTILEGPKTIEVKKEVKRGTKINKKGVLNVEDNTDPSKE